jgi:iron complex outermembrane recepter protein
MHNPQKMRIKYHVLIAALFLSIPIGTMAQRPDTIITYSSDHLLEMSMEDLMSVRIVSASRQDEKAFEAPISSYVISRNEILNAGITALPEALRLCPALFVKQMYNGVYDVSIRGFDNLATHDVRNTSKLLLVMINNRPVFDYHNGGTFWQDFPIDLIDIDRIEVVLGPTSSLYGPNAVAGVVNIVTVTSVKDTVSASAHVQAGTPGTYIAQGMFGYRVNRRLSVTGSVNYQTRGRETTDYYDEVKRQFITDITKVSARSGSGTTDLSPLYPHFERALKKVGGNVSANYKGADDVHFLLMAGFTNTSSLYGFSAGNPVVAEASDTRYGMLKGEIKGFSFLASTVMGMQTIGQSRYNLTNSDLYIDYSIKISNKFSIRPAVNYQHAVVDDRKYADLPYYPPFGGLARNMYNLGLSVKADYSVSKFRFIGAVRADKFKHPNDWYLSYQGIINYKINKYHILRAITARSNGGSFMEGTYLNLNIFIPSNPGNPYSTTLNILGNKHRTLTTNTLYELGYRGQLAKKLQLDVALFSQVIKGFNASVAQAPIVDNTTMNITLNSMRENLDLFAVQKGATVAINWLLHTKLNLKPYFTLQSTTLYHYSPYYNVPAADPDYNTETQQNVDGKGTPEAYGGFYANYAPTDKWNFNVNSYYMSRYEIYSTTSVSRPGPYNEHDISKIGDKFILNGRVGYQLTKSFNVFVNARNVFDNKGREFFATDKIGAMYLGGVNFTY